MTNFHLKAWVEFIFRVWCEETVNHGMGNHNLLGQLSNISFTLSAHLVQGTWIGDYWYRNWYQYWGHCCLINDLGSSPQPEGEARRLWWASQVVNETTMTEIEVSISILSWWNKINAEWTNTVNLNAQICPKTPLSPGYSMVTCAHLGVMWPDCFSLVTGVATTVMSQ